MQQPKHAVKDLKHLSVFEFLTTNWQQINDQLTYLEVKFKPHQKTQPQSPEKKG